jgi:hypothetical protein
MSGSARGGNDTLTGGDNNSSSFVSNALVGDASEMFDSARGGNDTLTGGDNNSSFAGSVFNAFNRLVGDASAMSGSSRGGNDTLIGGDNNGSGSVTNISGINATDQMWGDAESLADSATGGHDTFVFADAFGNDFVNDFHQHEDTLEFHVAGVADFSDLVVTFDGQHTVISTPASATDTVTLVGFTGTLAADDFMFC